MNRAVKPFSMAFLAWLFIGASNFFELAVAAETGMFGLSSGAALATVAGVLIEVPLMLSVVKFVNRTRGVVRAGRAGESRPARSAGAKLLVLGAFRGAEDALGERTVAAFLDRSDLELELRHAL